jgi:uncharacterized protein YlaI
LVPLTGLERTAASWVFTQICMPLHWAILARKRLQYKVTPRNKDKNMACRIESSNAQWQCGRRSGMASFGQLTSGRAQSAQFAFSPKKTLHLIFSTRFVAKSNIGGSRKLPMLEYVCQDCSSRCPLHAEVNARTLNCSLRLPGLIAM